MLHIPFTPILLKLEDFDNLVTNLLQEDPYIPPIEERTQNYILSPRYYFLIYPPQLGTNAINKVKAKKYDIYLSGLLANTLRINLKPSVGYGINSCYKIQLWCWHPVIAKDEESKPRRITQELISEQYLYVPPINFRTYTLDYDNYYTYLNRWNTIFNFPLYFNQPLIKQKELIVKRRYKELDSNILLDDITNIDVLDFFNFNSNDFKLIENYKQPELGKEFDKAVESFSIEWTNNYEEPLLLPNVNTLDYYVDEIKYSLDYIVPLRGDKLLFTDFVDERAGVIHRKNSAYL